MRKPSPKVIAGAVAGIAVAGGGAAVAATQFGSSPKEENQAILDDAAKQLGLQPSALGDALKKALENRVDAAVAAGRLTKAQGDELKQRIESGNVPFFAGPGFGPEFHHAFGPLGGGFDAAASYLGLTEAQLRTQLEGGKSLADVAKAQSKSVDGLIDAMVADAKQKLDAAVKSKRLTQSQEDSILGDLKARFTDFVNRTPPRFERFGRLGPPAVRNGFDGPGI
jgi:hypothetical protein